MTQPFLPNEADAFNANQAEPDSVDFEIFLLGHQRTGVISGCAVTESSPAAQTIDVALGEVVETGEQISVSLQEDEAVSAADGTNPRIDLISINSSGSVVVTAGTPAAQPVMPAVPATSIPLATLYVAASDNTHADNQINDKRVFVADRYAFNIREFGAVGDGSTDDSTAIQAAIDAAELVGGDVYFPASANEYMANTLIVDSDFVTLRGEGRTSVLKQRANGTLITLQADHLEVKGLVFDGDNTVRVTSTTMFVQAANFVSIHDCRFLRAVDNHIGIRHTGNVGVTDLRIFNNTFDDSELSGVRISDPSAGSHSRIWIRHNTFLQSNTTVTGGHGAVFATSLTDVTKIQYVWVQDNYISHGVNGDGVAIGFDSGTYIWITDNFIEGSNTTGGEGIAITAQHVTITGNLVTNFVATGILIWYDNPANFPVEHILISHNRCFSNEQGIALRWAHNSAVIANTVVMHNTCFNATGGNTQNFGVQINQDGGVTADTFDDCLVIWNNLINNNSGPLSLSVNPGHGGLIVLNNITGFAADTLVQSKAFEVDSNIPLDHRYGIVNVSTAAARTITLPDASDFRGKSYLIRRDGANTVTIDRVGSDTFDDGDVQKTLDSDGAAIGIFSIGDTEWKIVATEGTVGGS